MRLLPTMALEPPARYVAFVAAHLDPLREQAVGVAGEDEAQRLYPEVLTDVATRWRWLELLRRWLHRPHAADSYLRRAFARRCRRWGEETSAGSPELEVEVEVWTAERLWTERRPRPVRSSG